MPRLPTGSASLRGVGPRAPTFNPADFRIDVQSLGRAATLPARVAGDIEVLGAARRERGISEATFPARLETARTTAEGTAARTAAEQELLGQQAAGALALEPGVQELAIGQQAGDIGRLEQTEEAEDLAAFNQIEQEKVAAQQTAIELQDLEDNQAAIIQQKRQERANQLQQAQTAAVVGGQAQRAAEGTPFSRVIENENGRFLQTGITPPTGGEPTDVQTKTLKTAQEVKDEKATTAAELRKTTAQASELESRATRGNTRTDITINRGRLGETISREKITYDSSTGEVIKQETLPIQSPVARPTTPGAEVGGADEIIQSLESLTAEEAQSAAVSENGRTFIPSGNNQNGYNRGVVYTLSTGQRVVYTGGDPFDPNSFQPVE